MNNETRSAGGHSTVITYDNQNMSESTAPPLRRAIVAPFTLRAWSEAGYALVSLLLAIAALAFIVPTLINGPMWAWSTDTVRKFGAAARSLARGLLGEDIPAPPPIRPVHRVMVSTPDAVRLFEVAGKAGGKARVWESKPGVTITKLPQQRVTELAAEAGITITALRPQNAFYNWMGARALDPVAWRTRGYFALRLPLAAAALTVIAACWLGGLFCSTFPAWRAFGLGGAFGSAGLTSLSGSFSLLPLGGVLLLVAPWVLFLLIKPLRTQIPVLWHSLRNSLGGAAQLA